MQLKQYQADALSALHRFFEGARIAGPKNAYETLTREPEYAIRLGRYGGTYANPLQDLPNVPYVCLRLPTGGGKTILGAYAVQIARDSWVEKDFPLVLWLVPTNTIRRQTADALKNARHPYRQVLDEAFAGRVRVFDIADFTHIRPQDLRDHCCLVVGTIQTLRVANTEGRKVYAHHEDLEPHFSGVPPTAPGLETLDGGGIKFSFANLMHLHRPLMIVDEAHNAVTGLTREMQTRVNPCAIVEFTATPRLRSNILYSVAAQELKNEEMIKLPIILSEHDTWQSAVHDAVAARASLAEVSKKETGYVRPIVLFQAQKKNQDVPVSALKQHLLEAEQIPEHKIAVATGDQRELDGIDLFDPQCPIEYVITVEALKEGWDCSFAYVFCSVSRIQNAQNVEQLFGRVLRMPYAKRRQTDELNKAYAFLSEPSFGEAARALTDKLIAMGFEEDEACDHIQRSLALDEEGGLFGLRPHTKPTFRLSLTTSAEAVSALKAIEGDALEVCEGGDGMVEIAIVGPVSEALEKEVCAAIPQAEASRISDALEEYRAKQSPAERGELFNAPRLMCEVQGELVFADADRFIEDHEWSLLDYPARLDESEFALRQTTLSIEIDIDGSRLTHHFLDESEQLALNVAVEDWTRENLVIWLDQQVREIDLDRSELLKWLSDLVGNLTDQCDMDMAALMRCKFLLARKIRDKINAFRRQERERAYEQCLFAPAAKVAVSFDSAFTFKEGMYWNQRRYRGRWKPRKHFLGADNVPAFDGADDGEEVRCAQVLDSLPQVKYWIRNVASHPASFWLPTVNGKFYPDFVALLKDDRSLVVEYKGAHIADSEDTREKRVIGRFWERQSEGKALFIVAEKTVDGRDVRGQLLKKISG